MPIQPFPDFPSLSILPDCSTMIETKTLRAAQLYQLNCRLRCRAPHVSARASLPFSDPTRGPTGRAPFAPHRPVSSVAFSLGRSLSSRVVHGFDTVHRRVPVGYFVRCPSVWVCVMFSRG